MMFITVIETLIRHKLIAGMVCCPNRSNYMVFGKIVVAFEFWARKTVECSVKMDAKKKSHTNSEMSIIKDIYLGVDSQITVLCMNKEQELNPTIGRESMCIISAFIV